jgi:hypothetical protein
MPLLGRVHAHRRDPDPVLELDAPDLQRLKQKGKVRVLGHHRLRWLSVPCPGGGRKGASRTAGNGVPMATGSLRG